MPIFSTLAFVGAVLLSIMASDSKKKGESSSDQRLLNIVALGISLVALALTIFAIVNLKACSAYSGQIGDMIRPTLMWIKASLIVLFIIGAIINLVQLGKASR